MVIGSYRRALSALAIVSIVSLSLFIGVIAAQDATSSAQCPLGQGYWKNHAEAWPVADLMLGSQMYTQLELLGILNLPSQGDASIILAHQLIAAKLNIAAGGDATAISSMIAQADALLAAFPNKLPFGVAPSSTEGAAMTGLSGVLDVYNNGGLTVGCNLSPTPTGTTSATPSATPVTPTMTPSPVPTLDPTLSLTPTVTPPTVTAVPPLPDDDDCVIDVVASRPASVAAKRPALVSQDATPTFTPVPPTPATATPQPGTNVTINNNVIVVVEGPVQEINVNVITIYDIDIALNPADPLLTVIQIGDVIRVEGEIDEDCPTIVIIAVTVVIIDVDIVIIDHDHVWRDNGNCNNPPPPWAPAHGWRRRCEGGGGSGSGMGMGMGMGSGSGS